ncbi:hypothetical protein, partial [Janthinobacterium sp. CG_23.3]|uniref:hypothetical protein n=1 Tax=Janthinobacterium sp. CG_23.3 TaxID=3349634 RepID=UPI0038D4F2B1
VETRLHRAEPAAHGENAVRVRPERAKVRPIPTLRLLFHSTFECESESPSTQARSASHGQRKNCLPRRLLGEVGIGFDIKYSLFETGCDARIGNLGAANMDLLIGRV